MQAADRTLEARLGDQKVRGQLLGVLLNVVQQGLVAALNIARDAQLHFFLGAGFQCPFTQAWLLFFGRAIPEEVVGLGAAQVEVQGPAVLLLDHGAQGLQRHLCV
ncbi:hypothetical protein D3C80_1323250 [compost metagenome]